jgi:hypothetical protein
LQLNVGFEDMQTLSWFSRLFDRVRKRRASLQDQGANVEKPVAFTMPVQANVAKGWAS